MSKGALESWTPEDMYVRLNEVFKSMRRALLGGTHNHDVRTVY